MANDGANSKMQSYESKKKALFDCLDTAEKHLKGTSLDQGSQVEAVRRNVLNRTENSDLVIAKVDKKLLKFRGTESLFKKPELPLMKCLPPRLIPDFQNNPHKWKKYSLLDVDISDKTNSAAAFAFLQEIEATKKIDLEESEEINDKITFNKPKKGQLQSSSHSDDTNTDDKPVLKGSKLVMPEYIIGQKLPKKRKQNKSDGFSDNKIKTKSQLKLSHLQDEDNELVLNLEDIPLKV